MRLIFAGTPEFSLPPLRAVAESSHDVVGVFTQPDRPAGRGRKLRASPVKNLATELGLPVYQPETLRPHAIQQILVNLNADVMIVAAYGLLLPQAVLDAPRLGCINIHASLLPRWRGAAPIQRAILAGDEETGITIMQMAAGLDTGDILVKSATPIITTDTAESLHDRLAVMGAEALISALTDLETGTLAPEPQDETLANYAAKLTKVDAELDWTHSTSRLSRQVRAMVPWPVTQTRYRGAPFRVWAATPLTETSSASPGRVITTSSRGIDVATGDGALRLLRVQLPGGTPVSAREFVNAHSLKGVCFPA